MKAAGRKITLVTAYDHAMAGLGRCRRPWMQFWSATACRWWSRGIARTLPVTLDQMIYHAEMVGRAVHHAPGRGRHAVPQLSPWPLRGDQERRPHPERNPVAKPSKLEGGLEQAEVIAALVSAGIPVMAHCGLRPQNIRQAWRPIAFSATKEQLMADAQAVEQ